MSANADRKLRIGAKVAINNSDPVRTGHVVRHGRDASGIYTTVRMDDTGEKIRYHRSWISLCEEETAS